MKPILHLLAALFICANPAFGGTPHALVIKNGQLQQIQPGDTLTVNPATTSAASINLPQGTAPTSPNNGDIWTTSAGLFGKVNGVTQQIVAAPGTTISGTSTPAANNASISFQNSSKTAYQIYSPVLPGGYYFAGTVRAVADLEPGTTVQQNSAFDAYTFANVAQGSAPNQKNAVGFYALGVVGADYGATWGINTACVDNTTNGLATLTGRKCIGYEADFQVNGASTIQGVALIIQGSGTPFNANAFQVGNNTGTTAQWNYGFITNDGSTLIAATYGALVTSGTNIASQTSYYNYFDGSGVRQNVGITAINGGMNFQSSANPDYPALQTGNGNASLIAAGSDTNINVNLIPKGSGQTVSSAVIIAPGYATGASAGVTCASGTVSLSTMVVTNGIVTHC